MAPLSNAYKAMRGKKRQQHDEKGASSILIFRNGAGNLSIMALAL